MSNAEPCGVPTRTYSSWAPKIDLTTHLIASEGVVSHAAAVPKQPAPATLGETPV